jgi:hypothetical protein
MQPAGLPEMWNDDDQRLTATSQQEEGEERCQVVTEQAQQDWAR